MTRGQEEEALLIVFLLLAGIWIHGDKIDGWSSRVQPSMKVCDERARRLVKRIPPGAKGIRVMCTLKKKDK